MFSNCSAAPSVQSDSPKSHPESPSATLSTSVQPSPASKMQNALDTTPPEFRKYAPLLRSDTHASFAMASQLDAGRALLMPGQDVGCGVGVAVGCSEDVGALVGALWICVGSRDG